MKERRHNFVGGPLPTSDRFSHPASKLAALLLASVACAHAGPAWERPSLFLGSLDVDGGLRQRFELGVLSGSPEFSFPIYLEHGFRAEDPVTEYKIPQLETYVAPEGRDQILWLEPGGIRHLFKTTDILAKAPEKQKEPWVAIKAEAGNHEFRSNDGWVYRYESGSIHVNDVPKIWYDYDPITLHLITKRFWNGWIVRYETHPDGHPKSIVATDDQGKTITDCHYVWSPNGKLANASSTASTTNTATTPSAASPKSTKPKPHKSRISQEALASCQRVISQPDRESRSCVSGY